MGTLTSLQGQKSLIQPHTRLEMVNFAYSGCVFACLVCVIICASLLQAQPQLMAKFTTETEIPLNFLDSVTRTQNINIMC